MGNTTLKFLRPIRSTKIAVISFRGTEEMEARLIQAARDLNLKGKSELLHDIAEKFLSQHERRCIPMTRLERAQRTREIAAELRSLWCEPEPIPQRKTA